MSRRAALALPVPAYNHGLRSLAAEEQHTFSV